MIYFPNYKILISTQRSVPRSSIAANLFVCAFLHITHIEEIPVRVQPRCLPYQETAGRTSLDGSIAFHFIGLKKEDVGEKICRVRSKVSR